jgi:hypothetical protein
MARLTGTALFLVSDMQKMKILAAVAKFGVRCCFPILQHTLIMTGETEIIETFSIGGIDLARIRSAEKLGKSRAVRVMAWHTLLLRQRAMEELSTFQFVQNVSYSPAFRRVFLGMAAKAKIYFRMEQEFAIVGKMDPMAVGATLAAFHNGVIAPGSFYLQFQVVMAGKTNRMPLPDENLLIIAAMGEMAGRTGLLNNSGMDELGVLQTMCEIVVTGEAQFF